MKLGRELAAKCFALAGEPEPPPGRRPQKYGALPSRDAGGNWFASRRERRRWEALVLLRDAGQVDELERQVRFPIVVGGQVVTTYVADFAYREVATGRRVVEDAKGCRTAVYKLKRALMRAVNGIDIVEV